MPSEVDLSWAAGVFDGEGSVSIYVETARSTNVQLRMGMSHKETIDRFNQIVTHGTVYTTKTHKGSPDNYLRMWWWAASNRAAEEILKILLPYSVTKRSQIEVALEFRKLVTSGNTRRLTDAQLAERLTFKGKLLEARVEGTEPWGVAV